MDIWICGYINIYSVNQGFHLSNGAHNIRMYMDICIDIYLSLVYPVFRGLHLSEGSDIYIYGYRYMEI